MEKLRALGRACVDAPRLSSSSRHDRLQALRSHCVENTAIVKRVSQCGIQAVPFCTSVYKAILEQHGVNEDEMRRDEL